MFYPSVRIEMRQSLRRLRSEQTSLVFLPFFTPIYVVYSTGYIFGMSSSENTVFAFRSCAGRWIVRIYFHKTTTCSLHPCSPPTPARVLKTSACPCPSPVQIIDKFLDTHDLTSTIIHYIYIYICTPWRLVHVTGLQTTVWQTFFYPLSTVRRAIHVFEFLTAQRSVRQSPPPPPALLSGIPCRTPLLPSVVLTDF